MRRRFRPNLQEETRTFTAPGDKCACDLIGLPDDDHEPVCPFREPDEVADGLDTVERGGESVPAVPMLQEIAEMRNRIDRLDGWKVITRITPVDNRSTPASDSRLVTWAELAKEADANGDHRIEGQEKFTLQRLIEENKLEG